MHKCRERPLEVESSPKKDMKEWKNRRRSLKYRKTNLKQREEDATYAPGGFLSEKDTTK